MNEKFFNLPKEKQLLIVNSAYKILANAIENNLPYKITCPFQIICGEKDAAGYTKKYNKNWTAKTGYPIEWLPNSGHNSNTDKPDETNEIINNFIEKL